MLFYLSHSIKDATIDRSGKHKKVISERMLYVELDSEGNSRHPHYAPYLNYRPLAEGEPEAKAILARPECAWLTEDLENTAGDYAITRVVPGHLKEVRDQRLNHIYKTRGVRQGTPNQRNQLLGTPCRRVENSGRCRQGQCRAEFGRSTQALAWATRTYAKAH